METQALASSGLLYLNRGCSPQNGFCRSIGQKKITPFALWFDKLMWYNFSSESKNHSVISRHRLRVFLSPDSRANRLRLSCREKAQVCSAWLWIHIAASHIPDPWWRRLLKYNNLRQFSWETIMFIRHPQGKLEQIACSDTAHNTAKFLPGIVSLVLPGSSLSGFVVWQPNNCKINTPHLIYRWLLLIICRIL